MHKIFGSEVRHVQFQACVHSVQVNCRAVCQLSSIMTELVFCGCRTSYKKKEIAPPLQHVHTHTHTKCTRQGILTCTSVGLKTELITTAVITPSLWWLLSLHSCLPLTISIFLHHYPLFTLSPSQPFTFFFGSLFLHLSLSHTHIHS